MGRPVGAAGGGGGADPGARRRTGTGAERGAEVPAEGGADEGGPRRTTPVGAEAPRGPPGKSWRSGRDCIELCWAVEDPADDGAASARGWVTFWAAEAPALAMMAERGDPRLTSSTARDVLACSHDRLVTA